MKDKTAAEAYLLNVMCANDFVYVLHYLLHSRNKVHPPNYIVHRSNTHRQWRSKHTNVWRLYLT